MGQVWYFFVQILRGIGHHHGTGGGGTGHAPGRQLLAMVIGIQVRLLLVVVARIAQGSGQFHGETLFQLSFLFGKDRFGIFVRSHVFLIVVFRSTSGRKGRRCMFVNSFVQGVALQTWMRFVLLQRTLRINHQRRRCR